MDARGLGLALVVALLGAGIVTTPCASSAQARSGAAELSSPVRSVGHDPSQFALDITVLTVLPLAAGGAVTLEVPGHVVIRFAAGAIPDAYVDAINDVGTGWGVWGNDDAAVVSALLAGATYMELALGIRPAGTPGIEISFGYLMLWSHHPVGMSVVGAPGDRALGLDLTIDALHGEVAWQTELVDHVYFRLALGWAHAVAHRVSLATDATDDATRRSLSQAETALTEAVGRYAFGPTLGAALGARF